MGFLMDHVICWCFSSLGLLAFVVFSSGLGSVGPSTFNKIIDGRKKLVKIYFRSITKLVNKLMFLDVKKKTYVSCLLSFLP